MFKCLLINLFISSSFSDNPDSDGKSVCYSDRVLDTCMSMYNNRVCLLDVFLSMCYNVYVLYVIISVYYSVCRNKYIYMSVYNFVCVLGVLMSVCFSVCVLDVSCGELKTLFLSNENPGEETSPSILENI